MSKLTKLMTTKFKNSEYRKAFVKQNIFSSVAHQIQLIREHRGWSQKDLAEKIGTKQSAVSRLEDPAYGKYSISTLFKLADAFDLGLQIKFVSWATLTKEVDEWTSEKAVELPYEDEINALNKTEATVNTFTTISVSIHPTRVFLLKNNVAGTPDKSPTVTECQSGTVLNSRQFNVEYANDALALVH